MKIIQKHRAWDILECLAFFVGMPCFFFFHATRMNIHLTLWVVMLYALYQLQHSYGFTPSTLWQGQGWTKRGKTTALIRFLACIPPIIGLTYYLAPDKLFTFPLQRPGFWLVVMILYPILSVLPQEILFRCYFFQRAKSFIPEPWPMIMANACSFGLAHIVFHNWVSPTLCLIAGMMFAHSFSQHRSLKWAALEHAAYGCMIFTVGIGTYFLVGGMR